MNATALQKLGLATRDNGGSLEAELDLTATPLLNPLSRQYITRVQFMLVGDRLLAIDPPDVVGLPPIALGAVSNSTQLEEQLSSSFESHIMFLQRRSAELQAMGVPAQVDPQSLELSAQLDQPPLTFILLADKQGQFRVGRLFKDGQEMHVPTGQAFELSEFREQSALAGYLTALFTQNFAPPPAPATRIGAETSPTFVEVAEIFGPGARLPARSPLEVLIELRVNGVHYRFAAARLVGRSFRGLLAGPSGKLWAERFELEEFPGAPALLAETLAVPLESVEVVVPGAAAGPRG